MEPWDAPLLVKGEGYEINQVSFSKRLALCERGRLAERQSRPPPRTSARLGAFPRVGFCTRLSEPSRKDSGVLGGSSDDSRQFD